MHLGVVAIDEMVEKTRRIYTVEYGFSFMEPKESQISDLYFLFQDDGILVIPTIATIARSEG